MNRLIFVITLLVSTYSHAQWQQTNGPIGGNITTLLSKGNNLFAGTEGAGIILSTDSGISWSSVNNGLSCLNIRAMISDGNYLYAGTDNGGIFLSTNNGASWIQVNNGLSSLYINCLNISGGKIYAGTMGGLFLSTNNGNSWTMINTITALSLTISGSNIFAGAYSQGIFHSTDNGNNFTPKNIGLDSSQTLPGYWTFPKVCSFITRGNYLFAGTDRGIYVSNNNGASWSHSDSGIANKYIVYFIENIVDFYCANSEGIYHSVDTGKTWTLLHNSILTPPNNIRALAFIDTIQFAGCDGLNGGIYKSSNHGINWIETKTELKNTLIRTLTAFGNMLIAGGNHHLAYTTDYGTSWTNDSAGLPHTGVSSLAVNGNLLFAGACGNTSNCLYSSADSGKTWGSASNGLPGYETVQAIGVNGNYLFAGEFYGVWRSNDNGISWAAANNGLPYPNMNISTFGVQGTDLYAGSQFGVYYSTNYGGNWISIWNGMPNTGISSISFLGNKIFVGTAMGIYTTTNNGNTWIPSNAGIPTFNITSLAITGSNVFAATDSGVYASIDSGSYWYPVNIGLFNKTVASMKIIGNTIFAGTAWNSVFKAPVDSLLLQVGLTETNNTQPNISTYPNPTSGHLTVSHPINTTEISVADLLGQRVYIAKTPSGNQSGIDLSSFTPGIYFLQVRTENGVITRKIIKE